MQSTLVVMKGLEAQEYINFQAGYIAYYNSYIHAPIHACKELYFFVGGPILVGKLLPKLCYEDCDSLLYKALPCLWVCHTKISSP